MFLFLLFQEHCMITQVLDYEQECRCSRWLKRSIMNPNQAAIFFKQGKTFTLGVILPNLQEQYFSIAINGIEKKAIENNYNVLISQSHDDPKREKQIVETMRRNRVDGIIVSVSKNSGDYKHFQELEQFNIPVVFFDRAPEMPGAISVTCSLKNSTIAMVDLFVKKGIKKNWIYKWPWCHFTYTGKS